MINVKFFTKKTSKLILLVLTYFSLGIVLSPLLIFVSNPILEPLIDVLHICKSFICGQVLFYIVSFLYFIPCLAYFMVKRKTLIVTLILITFFGFILGSKLLLDLVFTLQ